MKKVFAVASALVLVGLVGCGGASSAGKDQVAAVNEMATILESIKDDKSADEALPKLEKAADKARAAGEKVASGKMSAGEGEKYAKELGDAQARLTGAAAKAVMAAPGKSKPISEALGKAAPKNVKMP